jgi:hypothetical protein
VKLQHRIRTADWQVFPTRGWNYALAVDEDSAKGLQVIEADVPARPFTATDAAVRMRVKGRRLTWRSEDGVANPLPASPVHSEEEEEWLTLVPYAGAKLRITASHSMLLRCAQADVRDRGREWNIAALPVQASEEC